MEGTEISVVIVSFNVWEYVKTCIRSLNKQQGVSFEVILVDNNSTDGAVFAIQEEFPTVRIIANTDNKGFSAANNQGIKVAKGNYILLLNPDTELKETDILLKLKQSLDINNPDGIVAPCLLNTDKSFQPSTWKIPGIKELFLELFYLHRIGNKTKPIQPVQVEAASGAALFFKKQLTDEIGVLDEKMFWMEDVDLCYRVTKAGKKVVYDPSISIIHHGGKSSTNFSVVIPNQILSKVKFYKKHGSVLKYIIIDLLSFELVFTRLIVFILLSFLRNDILRRKRNAYAVALKEFIRYNFSKNDAIISES
jgi:GT2 family glycosyltransferase